VKIYGIVHDTEPSIIYDHSKNKTRRKYLKVTLVTLVRHDDQNCDLDQWFPNFAERIPRDPRPVTKGSVDTFF